ncbi:MULTISPECIES: DUF3119 family protein [Spirulina sp. CCY15215]|uniref:DUF3119 family protein n=1 Tax=Spirulina sp. CCY15215 TaxID=2767591 RepID=UPI001951FB6C|nr:DUF3119 family protein [Spirulina major]
MTAVNSASGTIELTPSYTLPLAVVIGSLPLILFLPWLGGAIALFGLFLLFQAATLRLRFGKTALDVYRGEKLIRHFPYQDWLNWRIYWHPVPILFYFKEVKSIHFLPVLFDPQALKNCLEPLPRVD